MTLTRLMTLLRLYLGCMFLMYGHGSLQQDEEMLSSVTFLVHHGVGGHGVVQHATGSEPSDFERYIVCMPG